MAFNSLRKPFFIILCGFFVFTSFDIASTKASGILDDIPYLDTLKKTAQKEPPRAMWVWDVKIFQDEQAPQRLFKFCSEYNIKLLFYTAYNVAGNFAIDYRRFNKAAHLNGLSVHALAGDPRWALEKYHKVCLDWVEDVLDFNKNAMSSERFDGIHSDVEPYMLGKMWENNNKEVLIQYLDMNEKVKAVIAKDTAGSVVFVVDAPFWYDDDENNWVEWHQKFSPANYHLLDIVDQMVILDYRNFTEGENGSIQLAKNEIIYADRVAKKVYIGQETQKNLTPEYVSFAGKSIDYMEGQIKILVGQYIKHPSFTGIAMHHYISYKRFLRDNGRTVE